MRVILAIIFIIGYLFLSTSSAEEKLFQWQATASSNLVAPLTQTIPSNQYLSTKGKIALPGKFQGNPFIIAVRDPDCPVSRRYSPYLKQLQSSNYQVVYLLSGPLATKEIAQRDMQMHGIKGTYVLDVDRSLSNWLGVRTSSEVYLFDADSRLRYRGAIDDRFGVGFSRSKATQNFLNDALYAIQNQLAVNIPITSSPGCFVNTPVKKIVSDKVTWHKNINALMTDKCQPCHRPGQAAPFSLLTYDQVAQRKSMIRFVLENKIMPPWFASGNADRWVGGRHLASKDRQLLIDWIDAGAPEGDAIDSSAVAHEWQQGWQLGRPDIVLSSPRVLNIPAEGEIAYEYVKIPTNFENDRWVQSIEVSTDAPQNTHHIILFILPPDSGPLQNKIMSGFNAKTNLSRREMHLLTLRGFYGGYVQGLPGVRYQRDTAKLLPKGWQLLMQIHYEANGAVATDRPRVGIKFLDKEPDKIIETLAAATKDIKIPPGEPNHLESADYIFKNDGQIYGFFPHTHLRGTAFQYKLRQPDGSEQLLLDVPRYNPNWQFYYQLKKPIDVAAGSKLIASAMYNNSKHNPNNPNPDVEVKFGLQTNDEMMIGYFDWVNSP